MKRLVIVFGTIVILTGSIAQSEPIRLSASIPPLAAIARDVGGRDVEILTVLPPGSTPHHFEPGPELVRAMAEAEAHLVVGLELDPWAEKLARAANAEAPIAPLGQDLGQREGAPPDESAHEGRHDHDHGDPHVWMDPTKAATIATRIGDLLGRLRPKAAKQHRLRAAEVAARYMELGREWDEQLAPVRGVPFVTYHGGLHHLVARFDLHQVAVLAEFPGQEPSPKSLKGIIERIEESRAHAIFSEPQSASSLAKVVGLETGIAVTEIDLLGGIDEEMTYEALFSNCLETIVQALSPVEGR